MATRTDNKIRRRSGEINDDTRLVEFLYLLMRDHLPIGAVERIAEEVSESDPNRTRKYTNGWLAQYARDVAEDLALDFFSENSK